MKRKQPKVSEFEEFRHPPNYDIPIKIEDLSLGVVKIRFLYDKNYDSHRPTVSQIRQIMALVMELGWLYISLNRDVDLSRKFSEKSGIKELRRFFLYKMMCPGPVFNGASIPISLLVNYDDYFDFIKKEGPRTLRISYIQTMLEHWLSQANANEMIRRLERALMEYRYGPAFETKRFKEGRRPNTAVELLGKNGIRAMHKEITTILKPLKKDHISEKDGSAQDLINKSFKLYVDDLKKNSKEGGQGQADKYKRFEKGLYALETAGSINPISECIEENPTLKDDFFQYDWEPNKFAKEIIAKLLNVSVSTIDSVLYKQKVKP